ncbi:MAG: hypothetical protein JO127_08670 [Caulobacteraceae bacterium]|nr:hypothetical protein [Caulobacteraceae bacterium]
MRSASTAVWAALTLSLGGAPCSALAAGAVIPIEGDVFQTPPSAAEPEPGTACQVADAYVKPIQAGEYDHVADAFAPAAVFVAPNGQTLRGRAAIGAFYSSFLGRTRPQIIPLSFMAVGRQCVMELASRADASEPYRLAAIDHFNGRRRGAGGADGGLRQTANRRHGARRRQVDPCGEAERGAIIAHVRRPSGRRLEDVEVIGALARLAFPGRARRPAADRAGDAIRNGEANRLISRTRRKLLFPRHLSLRPPDGFPLERRKTAQVN